MKLEQLRPNIGELPEDEAYLLFNVYYEKRRVDISRPVVVPNKKKAATGKKKDPKEKALKLTAEQKDALRKLGLI